MKTTGSRASAVSQTRGFGDLLYDKAGARPSLDLDFAGTSSLRDKITGEYLVDHTRASNATYINNEGLVKEAPFNYHNAVRFNNIGSSNKDSIANPFNVIEDVYYMSTGNNHRNSGSGSTGAGGNSQTQMWASSIYMRTDQGTAEVEIDANDKNHKVVTVTDQWQRFSTVQTVPSNNNTFRFFDVQTSDNGTGTFSAANRGFGPTFGGTQTTTKVYMWGAQLEKNEVTDYMGQNDGAPRFTHERVETGNLLTDSTLKNPNHIKPHIRILQYQALAPDGTFSAAEMRCISSATNYMFANPTTSHIGIKDNTAYTVSIFAKKANTLDTFSIFLSEGGNKGAIFNLTNKTATVYGGGQNTARITETDNGWFRCEVTNSGNPTTVTSQIRLGLLSTTFVQQAVTAGQSFYFWGFQFEEGEAASTVAPSIDTFTSRQSNATYVDSAGLVKTAHRNLLKYSEDLSNSVWQKSSFTILSETTTAPNGTTTPWMDLTNYVYQDGVTNSAGTYTNSVYIKAETPCQVGLRIPGDTATNQVVNLTTEWQRFTITGTKGGATQTRLLIDNRLNHTSNTVKIAIWGAQQVKGTEAGDYAKTEATSSGAARYSHDPETLTPTGLYLEPAATNVILNSHNVINGTVNNVDFSSELTDESLPFPSYRKIKSDNSSTGLHTVKFNYNSLSANTNRSFSCFAKALKTGYNLQLRVISIGANSAWATFDLNTGQIAYQSSLSGTTTTVNYTWSMGTPFIEKHRDGWYRIGLTNFTASQTHTFSLIIVKDDHALEGLSQFGVDHVDNSSDYTFGIWGGQVEEGSYPSSYIPTTSSQVTRAADVYTSTANLTETFEPRGLLIEEARTNVIHNNTAFDTAWNNSQSGWLIGRGSITANSDIAPDGTQTADKFVANTENHGLHGPYVPKTWTSGNTVLSAYVKAAGLNYVSLISQTAAHNTTRVVQFDLTNGTVKFSNNATGEIINVGNGWYRVIAKITDSTNQNYFLILPNQGGNPETTNNWSRSPYQGNNSDGMLIWGAQQEAGSFATSLILNDGQSHVTRSADVASISGDNFGTYRTNLLTRSDQIWDWTSNSPAGTIHASDLQPYAYPNPIDGRFNASKYKRINGSTLKSGMSFTGNKPISVYVKPISNPCLVQLMYQYGTYGRHNFDLINKTTNGDGTGTIHEVGEGWLRLEWVPSSSSTPTTQGIEISGKLDSLTGNRNTGSSSHEFYLYGTQIEDGTQATNYIPSTDTFTSRLGNATYVDSNGLIKTAYKNYLNYSEEFNNAYWSRSQMALTVNAGIAPDGTNTADKVIPNTTSNATKYIYRQINPGGTLSIYAKADGYNYISLVSQLTGQSSGASLAAGVSVNLTDGSIQSIKDGTAEVIDVGNGWYRITLSRTDNRTQVYYLIQPHDGIEAPNHNGHFRRTFAGDGTSGVLIWGAMQTDSLLDAGEYTANTTVASGAPRYSHDPETLVPTGLYLEPAATNFIPRSNSFHYSNKWVPTGGSIALDNSVAAPTGETGKVAVFTEDTSTGAHNINSSSATSGDLIQTNNSSSYSLFVKPLSTRNIVLLRVNGIGTNTINLAVKLDDQTIHYKEGESGTSSRNITWTVNAHVEKYQNNWYRVVFNYLVNTTNATAGHNPKLSTNFGESNDITNVPNPYQGNGQKIMALFGLQNEVGAYASSYIETDGSAVTRPADTYTSTATTVLDRDGGNKEAFWSPTANTMFGEMKYNKQSNYPRLYEITSPNGEASTLFIDPSNDKCFGRLITQAGVQLNLGLGFAEDDSLVKIANTYQLNDGTIAINGAVHAVDNNIALHVLPTDTKRPILANIGNRNTQDRHTNAPIQRITHWKTRLPDASLINITNT